MFPISRMGVKVNFESGLKPAFINFSADRWRPVDVPLLLSAPNMHELGVVPRYKIENIIVDMLEYEKGSLLL